MTACSPWTSCPGLNEIEPPVVGALVVVLLVAVAAAGAGATVAVDAGGALVETGGGALVEVGAADVVGVAWGADVATAVGMTFGSTVSTAAGPLSGEAATVSTNDAGGELLPPHAATTAPVSVSTARAEARLDIGRVIRIDVSSWQPVRAYQHRIVCDPRRTSLLLERRVLG